MIIEKTCSKLAVLGGLISLISVGTVSAQSEEELARAAQNPVANMASLPIQNNTNFNIGPDDETQNVLNIQPVVPFSISDNWNVITRTIVPVVSQPDVLTNKGRENGFGDTNATAFFSPRNSGAITWGVGPTVLLPTATDDTLGLDQWGAGISAVALMMPGQWVIGALLSNIWDVGGSSDGQQINAFTMQPFVNYNLEDGWYLTTAPIITANWDANSDNRWTVPLGGGVGKIFKIGQQAMNAQVSAYKNVETPEQYGADWQLRVQVQWLFPK